VREEPHARSDASLDAPWSRATNVRKLRVPGDGELSFGAIATGGIRVLIEGLVQALDIPDDWIAVDAEERRELERAEREFRGDRPPAELSARTVILVDDGLRTRAMMTSLVRAVCRDDPARLVVAAPVARRRATSST
jgi:putative phosphoribosyl transferase